MSSNKYKTPEDEFKAFGGEEDSARNGTSNYNFIYTKEGNLHFPFSFDSVDFANFILECPPNYPNYFDVKEETFFKIEWGHEWPTKSEDNSPLALFIISLFLSQMREIVRTGLKKDYVIREENFYAKVKGRILHEKNLHKNVLQGHVERFYCSFQEYTADIPINRFLKRAIVLCKDIIASQVSNRIFADTYSQSNILPILSYCLSQMRHVQSETGNSSFLNNVKVPQGKLFRHYEEAANLARIIFRLEEAYSISGQHGDSKNLPDFWIYLPTLFEHYVWGKMNTSGCDVEIQPRGFLDQKADYIFHNPQVVVDAKFKIWYDKDIKDIIKQDDYRASMRDDFRELSGFARDHKYFPSLDPTIPCIIVYPIIDAYQDDDGENTIHNLTPSSGQEINFQEIFSNTYFSDIKPISGANGFYKVGLRLPLKRQNKSD